MKHSRCEQNETRHCEEQRDEAIQPNAERDPAMDCRVGLRPPRNDEEAVSLLKFTKAEGLLATTNSL